MGENSISSRIKALQTSLVDGQSILLSRNSDVFYFSSFINSVPEERNAFCLIGKNSANLIMQNFLPKPVNFPGEILLGTSPLKLTEHLISLSERFGLKNILLDLTFLNVEEFRAISKVPHLQISTLDKQVIWQLRNHKDAEELNKIQTAVKITKQALQETIMQLRVGMTELEVKQNLEGKIRQNLHTELAFPSIIAFDENSTLPHHQSGDKKLVAGGVVLIDVGAKYQEYCADMTRTVFFEGNSGDDVSDKKTEFEKILRIVQEAQTRAKRLLTGAENDLSGKGISVADLDLACRDYITEQGYGRNFIHTTGHGLGIDIHEPPSIYKTSTAKLSPGMVITIEPGIYLEGKFGVRWEDAVIL